MKYLTAEGADNAYLNVLLFLATEGTESTEL